MSLLQTLTLKIYPAESAFFVGLFFQKSQFDNMYQESCKCSHLCMQLHRKYTQHNDIADYLWGAEQELGGRWSAVMLVRYTICLFIN